MNDTKIASKAKAQLSNFTGKVFTHFSKPTKSRGNQTCVHKVRQMDKNFRTNKYT